jgi:hypothetical protein
MEFKGYRALSCSNGQGDGRNRIAHRVHPITHYTHEQQQYKCEGCGERYTTLEVVEKDNNDPESYIAKTLRFFRWRTDE